MRSLTLYEPAVWHILADEPVADQAALRLFDVAQRIVCLVEDGNPVARMLHSGTYEPTP